MMPRSADVFCKKFAVMATTVAACSVLFLTGCDRGGSATVTKEMPAAAALSVFAGCYTVSHDEPAQIKISEQNGTWVMQMKEAAQAQRVWDEPEALEQVEVSQIPQYFSIDPDNVDAVLARPDRVLVMAHVKPVYANIDPLLDSEYLAYIYKGANTIYKVECDDVNVDMLSNPHGQIQTTADSVVITDKPVISNDKAIVSQ